MTNHAYNPGILMNTLRSIIHQLEPQNFDENCRKWQKLFTMQCVHYFLELRIFLCRRCAKFIYCFLIHKFIAKKRDIGCY